MQERWQQFSDNKEDRRKMRIGIIIVFMSYICFSCNVDKKEIDKSSEPESIQPKDDLVNSYNKRDTVIFVNIEQDDYEELVKKVADITDNYFKPTDTVKLYLINRVDTLLIKKSKLVRLTKLDAADPYEAIYQLNKDTLTLENDCSGIELININDTLKIVYSYHFDCVESSSYSQLRYYLGLGTCLIYHDDFSEEWIPQYIEESKIKSKRKESFFLSDQDSGYRLETIRTTTDLDTIKVYRIDTIEKMNNRLIRKLLPASGLLNGGRHIRP